MKIKEVALTDVGRKRELNEDSFLVLKEHGLFLVADGMGGHSAGEVASKLAVETIAEFIKKTSTDRDITWPFQREDKYNDDANRLIVATKLANAMVYNRSRSSDRYHGMGTTIVAALVSKDYVYLGHVGDSRIYRIRDGEIEQMTEDHSLLSDHIRTNKLTAEEIANFPFKNVITRALGVDEEVEVDLRQEKAQVGDYYLLCCDGLTTVVKNHEIRDVIIQYSDNLEVACKTLIDMANERGGPDNITVVIFKIEALDGSPTEVESEQPHLIEKVTPSPELEEEDLENRKKENIRKKANKKFNKGKIAFEEGRYKEAVGYFKHVLELDPEYPSAREYLIKSKKGFRQLEEAKKEEESSRLKQIIQLLNEGKSYFQSGEYLLAKQYIERVLHDFPDNKEANQLLEKVEEKLKSVELVKEEISKEKEQIEERLQLLNIEEDHRQREVERICQEVESHVVAQDIRKKSEEEIEYEEPIEIEATAISEIHELLPEEVIESTAELKTEELSDILKKEIKIPDKKIEIKGEITSDEGLEGLVDETEKMKEIFDFTEQPTIELRSPFIKEKKEEIIKEERIPEKLEDRLELLKKHLTEGFELLEKKDYSKSLYHLNKIKELDKEGRTQYFNYSTILIKIVIPKLKCQLQPILNLAKIYYENGDLYKSYIIFKKIIEDYPDYQKAKDYMENINQLINWK